MKKKLKPKPKKNAFVELGLEALSDLEMWSFQLSNNMGDDELKADVYCAVENLCDELRNEIQRLE